MSYTIDYSNESDPIAKHNKAIEDIKEYVGEDRFETLTQQIKEEYPNMSLEQFQLVVSFAGVQGYPAKAWFNYCYGL